MRPVAARMPVMTGKEGVDEVFDVVRPAGDDGEHVAIVYGSSMELKDGTRIDVGSMEIFRVVDGRIIEVWNCGHKQGVWQ